LNIGQAVKSTTIHSSPGVRLGCLVSRVTDGRTAEYRPRPAPETVNPRPVVQHKPATYDKARVVWFYSLNPELIHGDESRRMYSCKLKCIYGGVGFTALAPSFVCARRSQVFFYLRGHMPAHSIRYPHELLHRVVRLFKHHRGARSCNESLSSRGRALASFHWSRMRFSSCFLSSTYLRQVTLT
jgi:hypothetical protein